MSNDLLMFTVAEQRYGLPVACVREVVPRARLSHLPGAPTGVLGLLRIADAVMPVLDLRVRLGLPAAVPHISQGIVVTRTGGIMCGLLVDGVDGVVAATDTDLPSNQHTSDGQLVRRIQTTGSGIVTILNPDAAPGPAVAAYMASLAGTATERADHGVSSAGVGR